MELSMMSYRGINGGIGWSGNPESPFGDAVFYREQLKSQTPTVLTGGSPENQTLQINAPLTVIGCLSDGRVAIAFRESLEDRVRPAGRPVVSRTAFVTFDQLRKMAAWNNISGWFNKQAKTITFGDYSVSINQIDPDVEKLIAPTAVAWVDNYLGTDSYQHFYPNPEVNPFPKDFVTLEENQEVRYEVISNSSVLGPGSNSVREYIFDTKTQKEVKDIDTATYDMTKNEWVWGMEKVDIFDKTTFPTEFQIYLNGLEARQAAEAESEQGKIYLQEDENFHLFYTKATLNFLKQQKIDITAYEDYQDSDWLDYKKALPVYEILWRWQNKQRLVNGEYNLRISNQWLVRELNRYIDNYVLSYTDEQYHNHHGIYSNLYTLDNFEKILNTRDIKEVIVKWREIWREIPYVASNVPVFGIRTNLEAGLLRAQAYGVLVAVEENPCYPQSEMITGVVGFIDPITDQWVYTAINIPLTKIPTTDKDLTSGETTNVIKTIGQEYYISQTGRGILVSRNGKDIRRPDDLFNLDTIIENLASPVYITMVHILLGLDQSSSIGAGGLVDGKSGLSTIEGLMFETKPDDRLMEEIDKLPFSSGTGHWRKSTLTHE
jgi:hypothetical protein